MMSVILFILWILSTGIAIYIQLKHAGMNYPESPGWLFVRFGSAFTSGVILGIGLFHHEFDGIRLIAISFLSGITIGVLLTFISQARMRRLIPKNGTPKNDSVRE